MIILAIESSCDDTCVAILKDKELLSNVVSSQTEFHNKYGGVMPELASRLHVEKITYVIKEAVSKANITLQDVDYIAFTVGPGLVGSLHVGMQAAKTLALLLNKPIVPIHHLAGHIYANRFVKEFTYPLLALVVSGGHTDLVYMKDNPSVLAQTTGWMASTGVKIDELQKYEENIKNVKVNDVKNMADFVWNKAPKVTGILLAGEDK